MRKVPDEVMIGKEPWYADPIIEPNDTRLAWALNWYNYSMDVPTARKYVVEWMQKVGYMADDWIAFSKANNDQIPMWICAYSRMMLRGNELPAYCVDRLKDRVAEIVANAVYAPVVQEETPATAPRPIKRVKLSDMVADIDDAFDAFYRSGYKTFVFDGTTFVKKHDVKPLHARQIVEHFQPLQEEIFTATIRMEGFDHLTQKQLETYRKAVGAVQAFFFRLGCEEKKARKPRKKKVKTPLQLVKYLKFALIHEQLKSVDPTSIIGAKCLWAYNHKYRTIIKIVALNGSTLSVKGSTVTNVYLKESMAKRLRKPNEVLPKVLTGGKVVLKNIFKELTTKPSAFSPRINSDTVLLRIT